MIASAEQTEALTVQQVIQIERTIERRDDAGCSSKVSSRMMYLSICKTHQLALHSYVRVMLDTLTELLAGRTGPRVKLH